MGAYRRMRALSGIRPVNKESDMTLNFKTLRLMFSGAIVGVAIAGMFGVDTSSVEAMGVASAAGAGSTLLALKSMAII